MTRPQGFSPKVRALIAERSGGICEIQDRCDGAPAVQVHHRAPRGAGSTKRAWVNQAANGLAACYACHAYAEGWRTLSLQRGWLVSQHGREVSANVPVLYRGRLAIITDLGTVEYQEVPF